MSAEVNKIKELWQQGEQLSTSGKHTDALLNFQRAKALLLVESKNLFGTEDAIHINNNSVNSNGSVTSKLMESILTKLTASINRDVKLINANPVHALGLSRGFSKTDVKKAYRAYALKYHPDKNQDCDTSLIFTAIQSSYEKLNATIDSDPSADTGVSSGRGTGGNAGSSMAYKDFAPDDIRGSKFYHSHKDVGRRGTGSTGGYKVPPRRSGPSPYEFDQTRTAPRAAATGSSGGGRGATATASAVSGLTTEHLKVLLKQFGLPGGAVDNMGRAELIKKYLGVSNFINKDRNGNGAGKGGGGGGTGGVSSKDEDYLFRHEKDAEAPSAPPNAGMDFGLGSDEGLDAFELLAKGWTEEWMQQMRSELDRENTRKDVDAAQERMRAGVRGGAAGPPPFRRGSGQRRNSADSGDGIEYTHVPGAGNINKGMPAASPYASNFYTQQKAAMREEEKLLMEEHKRETLLKKSIAETRAQLSKTRRAQVEEELKRASLADALRIERANWLRDKLPIMKVVELRRIMQTSGMETEGCVDRGELVHRICRHYGIAVEPEMLAGLPQANSARRSSIGSGLTPAEAAMKSRFAAPLEPLPSRAPVVAEESLNTPVLSARMDADILRKVVASSSGKGSFVKKSPRSTAAATLASGAGISGYITKEKLMALEKRVLGTGRDRGGGAAASLARNSTNDTKSNVSVPPLPSSPGAVASLDSVLANAARAAAKEEISRTPPSSRAAANDPDSAHSGHSATTINMSDDGDVEPQNLSARSRGSNDSSGDDDEDDERGVELERSSRRPVVVPMRSTHKNEAESLNDNDEEDDDENEEDALFFAQLRQRGWDLGSLSAREDAVARPQAVPKLSSPSAPALDSAVGVVSALNGAQAALDAMPAPPAPQLGLFNQRDKEQILAFESLLEQAERESEEAITAHPPGRIRPSGQRPRSSGQSVKPISGAASSVTGSASGQTSHQAVPRSGIGGLQLDLKALQRSADDNEGEDGPGALQEEVDFWVHSARGEAESRRTLLELELARRVQQDKDDRVRAEFMNSQPSSNQRVSASAAVHGEHEKSPRVGFSPLDDTSTNSRGRQRATSPIISPTKVHARSQAQHISPDRSEDESAEDTSQSSGGETRESDAFTEVKRTGADTAANPFLFFG